MRARARGARGGAVMLIGKRVERFGKTVESPKDLQSSIAPSSLFLCASAVPNSLDLTASTHTYMRAHTLTHMYRVCVGEHLYV